MRSENTAALQFNPDTDAALPLEPLGARPPCRILVVDDDELVRVRLAEILIASRYAVELAASGEEALRILNATRCDIVLTDWQMPDMDGLALCRLVRMRDQGHYSYLLMLTIRDTPDDVLAGLAAGADDYVVKGTSIEEILARLETGRRITHRTDASNLQGGLTHTDPATGVHSLGYLVQHLPRELARSQRYGHALAVITCDIDRFERIQNSSGGDSVEELLRMFVHRCVGCIRKGDWLARTGPNAFIVVLPETKALGARCVARKLRSLCIKDPSRPSDTLAFNVRIAVTAVEAKLDLTSISQIEALLRAAMERSRAELRAGWSEMTDRVSSFTGVNTKRGGNNGIH
jgi:two-component system cell cycle response regulator